MSRLHFVVALAFVAAACSAQGRVPSTLTDGGAEPPSTKDAATDTRAPRDGGTFIPDAQLGERICERPIDVGALAISLDTCFVNEHVSHRSGKLTFPCDGGDASIEFDGKTFSGTVQGDDVHLKLVEPFVYNNCQWQSTETIDGSVTSGTLSYRYEEKPLAACTDTPCTADGSLSVESGEVVVVK